VIDERGKMTSAAGEEFAGLDRYEARRAIVQYPGGLAARYPVIGALWLAGAVAITGAPPFGLFLSEITIMRAGLAGAHLWAVLVLLVLLIVIFIGFLNHFREMYYVDAPPGATVPTLHPSVWMTLPMWLALVPVLVLGVWWPDAFWQYFGVVAQQLAGQGR